MTYKITRLEDIHKCETCGTSYSMGWTIHKDGVLVVDKTPHSHCYDSNDYSCESPYADILEHMGIEVQEEGE